MSVSAYDEKKIDLIAEYYGLVEIIVKAYIKQKGGSVIEYDDLLSLGYSVLCVCAKNYQPERAQFNGYLTTAIRRKIKTEEAKEFMRLNHMLSGTPETDYLIEIADAYEGTGVIPGVEEEIVAKDSLARISEKLDSIAPGALPYHVLFDHLMKGDSQGIIAKTHNKPSSTIEAQVRKIRKVAKMYPQIFADSFADTSEVHINGLKKFISEKKAMFV